MALYTWFLVGLLCIVAIIGIPGNILVLVVYYNKTKRTGTRVFIIALAGVDFFICALSSYRFYLWIEEETFSSDFVCRLFSWVGLASELSSAFVTTAVAVDRYLAICRPHLGWMTHKRAQIVSLLGIVASTLLTMPALVVYMVHNDLGTGTSRCETMNPEENRTWVFMALFLNVIAFAGMMALALIMYMLIYREVRKRLKIRPSRSVIKVDKKSERDGLGHSRPLASMLTAGNMDSVIGISLNTRQGMNARRHSIGEVEGIASKEHQTRNQKMTGSPLEHRRGWSLKDRVATVTSSKDSINRKPDNRLKNKRVMLTTLGSSSEDTGSDGPRTKLTTDHNKPPDKSTTKIAKNKTGKMLLLATVVFVVTWSARWIMWLISYLLQKTWTDLKTDNEVAFAFLILLQHLYYTTPAVNPAIYSFVNNRFREECVKVLRRIRFRNFNL